MELMTILDREEKRPKGTIVAIDKTRIALICNVSEVILFILNGLWH